MAKPNCHNKKAEPEFGGECHHSDCEWHWKSEPMCGADGLTLEQKLVAQGYDLDELELENPYNGVNYEE
jgi:hypothetical protein